MPLSKVPQYETIIESYLNGQKSQAISQISELPITKLTDFVRYASEQLEGSDNKDMQVIYRTCRHNALVIIDTIINNNAQNVKDIVKYAQEIADIDNEDTEPQNEWRGDCDSYML